MTEELAKKLEKTELETKEQNITPWEVEGAVGEDGEELGIDYDKLIAKFGTSPITEETLQRFEDVTGHKPHHWLRKGVFFSERDFSKILDMYEHGEPFFLYTGRGPSSDSMHLGHMIPFVFTKWLQDVFDCPLVIELTDDEKFLFKPKLTIDNVKQFSKDNCKDIIACGFKPENTFIFSDLEYMGGAFTKMSLEPQDKSTVPQQRPFSVLRIVIVLVSSILPLSKFPLPSHHLSQTYWAYQPKLHV